MALPDGERLRLAPTSEADLREWKRWFLAAGPERLTCRPVKDPDVSGMAARHREREAAGEAGFFSARRIEDDALVGRVTYFDVNPRNGACEIGFIIAPEERGKGYAREALSLLLRHLFEELGLKKAMAQTGDFNDASLKLLRSLGFQEDGRLRRHHVLDGVAHDDVLMSLLAEEFGASCQGYHG